MTIVTGVEAFACERYDGKALFLKWDAVFLSLGSSLLAYGSTRETAISRAIGQGSMFDADKATPIAGCITNAIAHDIKLHVMSISFRHAQGISQQYFSFADHESWDRFMWKLLALQGSQSSSSQISHPLPKEFIGPSSKSEVSPETVSTVAAQAVRPVQQLVVKVEQEQREHRELIAFIMSLCDLVL